MTNYLDKICRYLVKQDPAGFIRWLYGLTRVAPPFHLWLDSRRLALPDQGDLTNDLVARLEYPDEPGRFFDVVLEIMAESRPETIERLLAYVVRLRGEQDPGSTLPRELGGVIVNLSGPAQPFTLRMEVPDCSLVFTAAQRTLREEEATRTLEDIRTKRISRWLLTWLPLLNGGDEAAILNGWLTLVNAEPDIKVRTTLAGFTRIFADHAGRLKEWKRVLEGWDMKDSPLLLEWLRQGEEQAEARGRTEGRVEEAQAILIRIGRKHLGRVTKRTQATLEGITDLERLERMTDRLLDVETWADLLDTP